MKNFLSILKTVGKDLLAIDVLAAPVVMEIDPAIGNAMNLIGHLVISAEKTYPATGSGEAKHAYVASQVDEMLPELGGTPAKDSALSELIDATVAQFNAAAKLQTAKAAVA